MDDGGTLIHLPDEGPDFTQIADDIGDEAPGDLAKSMDLGTDEPPGRRDRPRPSPTRAEMRFVQVDLPPALYPLFMAWEIRQQALKRPLPEGLGERYQLYLVGACGRDAEQDDVRPAGAQEYDMVTLLGQTFAQVLSGYAADAYARETRPALRDQRAMLKARLAERLPEWTDDDLEEAFGPTGEEG